MKTKEKIAAIIILLLSIVADVYIISAFGWIVYGVGVLGLALTVGTVWLTCKTNIVTSYQNWRYPASDCNDYDEEDYYYDDDDEEEEEYLTL